VHRRSSGRSSYARRRSPPVEVAAGEVAGEVAVEVSMLMLMLM
jgi:hypothetical protein